jgi:glutaredoxin
LPSRAAAVLALVAISCFAPRAEAREAPALELFVRAGCPHCARAEAFLDALAERHPELRIERRDVGADAEALARLRRLAEAAGVQAAVPAFHASGRLVVGFRSAETTGREIEALLLGAEAPEVGLVDVPILGRVRAGDLGLPLFSLALGLLDGFNPCAMWVLLFLLSLLVHLRSRRRIWIVGGTFIAVSGLVYYAFLAAWLNLFLWVGLARPVQLALGVAAVAMGSVHLKDALAPGRGPSLGIPESARPGIYARVRRVLYAENLAGALAAVALLALLVNAVELLCSAGLPALYTRVLTFHELPAPRYYAYLALYDAAYVFDDTLVLAAATALGGRKLQERQGRWLNALSGALLVLLGALVALRPEWLR